uniref:hypothetical protein n=1 Tax=Vibrio cholerae TaxID=666 RepID=UPI003F580795
MIEQVVLQFQQQIESLHFGHGVAGYFSVQVFGSIVQSLFSAANKRFLDGLVKIFLSGAIAGIYATTPEPSVRSNLVKINREAYLTEQCTYD